MLSLRVDPALLLVVITSLIIGFVMTLVYRYASNQSAIRLEKNRIKANLLAIRVYRDELSVAVQSYGRVISGTVRYLRFSLKPLLFSSLPFIFLVIQADRYLSFEPLSVRQPFLISVAVPNSASEEEVTLQVPDGLKVSVAPVHMVEEHKIVWRLSALREGKYIALIRANEQSFEKQVIVSSHINRLSAIRLRAPWWKRVWISSEPALPKEGIVECIEVGYSPRYISFAWLEWNWIWLLFLFSVVWGFVFKWILGVEI